MVAHFVRKKHRKGGGIHVAAKQGRQVVSGTVIVYGGQRYVGCLFKKHRGYKM